MSSSKLQTTKHRITGDFRHQMNQGIAFFFACFVSYKASKTQLKIKDTFLVFI